MVFDGDLLQVTSGSRVGLAVIARYFRKCTSYVQLCDAVCMFPIVINMTMYCPVHQGDKPHGAAGPGD